MEVNSHSINTARQSRIQEIDLLRFLAALAVVLYHYTFRGVTASEQSIMPYP
jgi:peptidoglycan/LPS O-acetylase OafA/YrhL